MDRQRRANNPDNFAEKGRMKKQGKQRLKWKQSKRYLAARRRKASRERKLAAHRKSLHGRLVHEIVAQGNTIITEKISYRAAHEAVWPRVWAFVLQGCSEHG